ncbi:DUF805 domain-containing protein [soil metagenome]
MNGNIDWRDLFLSADGRLARTPFLIGAAILLVPFAFYQAVDSLTFHIVTGWLVYPLLIYCGVCVLSKRLHDRGRSGWFALPIVLGLIATAPWPNSFFDFLWMLVIVWAAVELGVLPGEQGANRFGVNPLRPAIA